MHVDRVIRWTTTYRIKSTAEGHRPALLLSILLILVGVQFVSLGLLGEMLARTYHESQRKPTYVIKEQF